VKQSGIEAQGKSKKIINGIRLAIAWSRSIKQFELATTSKSTEAYDKMRKILVIHIFKQEENSDWRTKNCTMQTLPHHDQRNSAQNLAAMKAEIEAGVSSSAETYDPNENARSCRPKSNTWEK
jgi:hypothetical protein